MLAAVKGYYDGTQIVVDENDKKHLMLEMKLLLLFLIE